MASENPRARIAELRERWEAEPSSRLFLQLAEEYRRLGSPRQAIEVLETGLQHHPGSGAARVALGRCHMEAGMAREAAEILEGVVRRDPTQMVAYRCLVDTYIQLEDSDLARERLALYAQLNPQDPDIDRLAESIAKLDQLSLSDPPQPAPSEPRSESQSPEPTQAEPEQAEPEKLERQRLDPREPEPAQPDPLPHQPPELQRPAPQQLEPSPPEPPPPEPVQLEPLPPDPRQHQPMQLEPPQAEPQTPEPQQLEPEAPEATLSEAESPEANPTEDLLSTESFGSTESADLVEAQSVQRESEAIRSVPASMGRQEHRSPQPPARQQGSPLQVHGSSGVLGSVVLDPSRLPPPPRLASLEPRRLRRRWQKPAAPASSTRSNREGKHGGHSTATATLGSLYLKQGHEKEAAEIFRGVLERQPQDQSARRGLVEARADGSDAETATAPVDSTPPVVTDPPARAPLTARDLAGGLDARVQGLTDRKLHVLRQYLSRLTSSREEPSNHRFSTRGLGADPGSDGDVS